MNRKRPQTKKETITMTQAFSLKDKTILITGASNGIGKAIAQLAANFQANLILTGRNEERLKAVKEGLTGDHQMIRADLTQPEELEKLVNEIEQLDGIVHSAGIVKPLPIQFLKKNKIDEVANINFYVPVEINRLLFKQKKINKNASIVFISSISSHHPFKGGAVYTSFKAALETYSKSVALEMAHKGIRSNCIKAGLVETHIMEVTAQAASTESLENHRKQYPLGFGKPEDVANAVVFLLSDASQWMTGTNLVLDGGLTISKQ